MQNLTVYKHVLIAHQKKFIFVQTPRTASTSIYSILREFDQSKKQSFIHMTAEEAKEMYPSEWRTYFKFCFVRNPWDRAYSYYSYRKGKAYGTEAHKRSFNQWLNLRHVRLDGETNKSNFELARLPQFEFLQTGGCLEFDFIGRYERLELDFEYLCKRLNIEYRLLKKKNSSSHDDYKRCYDLESKRRVANLYKKDIECFKYDFV